MGAVFVEYLIMGFLFAVNVGLGKKKNTKEVKTFIYPTFPNSNMNKKADIGWPYVVAIICLFGLRPRYQAGNRLDPNSDFV